MTLPELAIRRPITTLVMLISIFVIGLIALDRLPLAFQPDMEEPEIYVVVNYPNASPKAVERMIIRPLEDALGSISGLKRMWSSCDNDGGRVSLNFDWDANMDDKRAEIRERVDRARAELPDDVERIMLATSWNPRESGDTIIEGRLSSGRDLSKDYDLLERRIIRPLERIPGVASVILDGVNPREIKINLNLNALRRHNIDPRTVARAINQNNMDRSLGMVRNDQQKFSLRAIGSFQDIEEIGIIPIPNTSLRLADVADITYEEPPLEYGRHLDGEFAIGVSITKESAANTVQVSQAVKQRVAEMGADPELEGINFLVWEDQGREILKTIGDLQQTGLFGAFLACVILYLFLKRFTTTIIAVISIPFSLVVACGVIWAQGKTLNTISLLGLIVGIGMLVDNAVVIMENIVRYQQKGHNSRVSALLGAREVSVAVIAATLTSCIVFAPLIFTKPSEMNIILQELALTVVITLIASLFVSQTLIPLATGRFLKPKPEKRTNGPVMQFLQDKYAAILRFTLRHKYIAPIVGILMVGATYYPFTQVETNFDAEETEMYVNMMYRFSEDVPLDRKQEIVTEVENALFPHKERLNVNSIYSWWADSRAITRLYMKDGFTNQEYMNSIRKQLPPLLPKIAGVKVEVTDSGRFWRRGSGNRVAFQLQGQESETLSRLAEEARVHFEAVPELFGISTSDEGGSIELHTRVDRRRIRQYGLDLAQPAEVISLTFRGQRLPRFKDDEKGEVEMRLTLNEQSQESVEQLRNLPLLREDGPAVTLDSFADFAAVQGPDRIRRENKATNIWVTARFEEGDKMELANKVRAGLESMDLPYGYSWDFQSFGQRARENQREYLLSLLLALGLIFGVMAALFESIRQALGLMFSLPFALFGTVWTLYIFDIKFDQPASVGLLLLIGIVVNNGIVMVEHFNQYRRRGVPRELAMIQGGKERLRPILMTALTTLVGLVPMAVQKPSLGNVYYYSMAYVIMGGLLLSTIMTTLFLPTTICLIEDFIAWIARKLGFELKDKQFQMYEDSQEDNQGIQGADPTPA